MSDPDDEPIEEGDPSFIYEDTGLPPTGNIFWTTLANIWGAITVTFDNLYEPFAADDDTVSVNIKNDYNEFVKDKLEFHDGKADTCETTPQGKNAERNATYSDLTMGSPGLLHVKSQRESQSDSQGESQREWSQVTASQQWSQPLMDDADMKVDDTQEAQPVPDKDTLDKIISKSSSGKTAATHPTLEETTVDFVNDSSGKTAATHPTLDNGGLKHIIQEESYETKREIQSVATSVLSGLFAAEKMNVGKLLAGGDASKVYKAIANILYKQNVVIDVREGAARGKSNEGQMREVWGSVITDYAKSDQAKCYLCGGQIVPFRQSTSAGGPRQGGQPEMEHKLPCAVFYAKFAFIYSCFAAELVAWRTYVANLNENSRLMDYYILMNSNDAGFDKTELNAMYKSISADFLKSFDNKRFDATNLELFVKFVLPAYLSEFAYAHHLCNQLKSNHDLSDTAKLQNYYEGLVAILNMSGTDCDISASKNLKAACLNRDICREERNAIIAALFPKKTVAITSRKDNVQEQNNYLQGFAREYAKVSQTTEKRMILHTIKETIKMMKVPIPSGKVTKKAVIQMNGQARIIAQGLQPITKEVRDFLNAMDEFKNNDNGTPSSRLLQKSKDKLRVYLDRTHQIFENACDAINNIRSQLQNAYVDPDIKTRIYKNAREYNNILSNILDRVDNNVNILKILLGKLKLTLELEDDDDEMLIECRDVVDGLNANLDNYADKNPEVGATRAMEEEQTMKEGEALGVAPQLGDAPAMEEGEALGLAPAMEEGEALGLAPPIEVVTLPSNRMDISARPPAPATSTLLMTLKPSKKEEAKARRVEMLASPEIRETANPASKPKRGGKKKHSNKTRKVKKHHRKTIKKSRARKFTMKYKYISKKNTRRR